MSEIISAVFLTTILGGTLPRAIPILAASVGELVSENAGVLNLGVEGYMLMGASVAFIVDFYEKDVALAFVLAGLAGLLFAFFHAVASVSLRADQIVSGTALWFIGWGLSGVLYRAFFAGAASAPGITVLAPINVPYLSSIPIVGTLLFGQDPVAYIILASLFGVQFFLYHTKAGLNLRTVGEDPKTAEIAGVNPIRYRYGATMFSGFMSGIGGAYLILAVVGTYYFSITAGIGFIAVALVYFGKWRPPRMFIGSLIFGMVFVLYITLESYFQSTPNEFFEIWPYLATLIIIVVVGARARPPASLAKPYTREA